MINLQSGDRVVCIDDAQRGMFPSGIRKGEVYTIDQVLVDRGVVGVSLCGVESGHHRGWYADRFRKVREAQIDVLRAIAANCPALEKEAAQ